MGVSRYMFLHILLKRIYYINKIYKINIIGGKTEYGRK